MSSLTPIGPQPPTQPGWYWNHGFDWPAPFLDRIKLDGGKLYAYPGGSEPRYPLESFHMVGIVWQPVAAPTMEEA